MGPSIESWQGRSVLTIAHIAGMIDLVALPVWVGTSLIGQYHFSAPLAGAMVTAYLLAVAAASLIFAPRFHRIKPAIGAPVGYTVAAVAFLLLTVTRSPALMFALHVIAGFSVGAGLSMVHGTIGRSARPHRLFAIVTIGLGMSGIVFLGLAQGWVQVYGGFVLFVMFAALMAAAALATGLAFPQPDAARVKARTLVASPVISAQPRAISAHIWWVIAGVTVMAVSQAMMFSFVERIGTAHGFAERVQIVLISSALVNLLAAAIAGLLELRLMALKVALCGAVLQATLAVAIVFGADFPPYAIGTALFVSAMIITHTFVFGWLSRNDASGRAVALTPAMLMSGAAIGPLIGGLLFAGLGEASLAVTAMALDAVAFACYVRALLLSRSRADSLGSLHVTAADADSPHDHH